MVALANLIARVSILVAGITLAAILTLVAAQIGMRVFTGSSLSWSDELARLCFIYLVFIGASEASARRAHIAINLRDTFGTSARTDRLLDIVRMSLCVAVLAVIAWGAWQIIPVVQNMKLPATRISTAWLYLPVLVGSLMMIVATVLTLIAAVQDRPLLDNDETLDAVE